MAQTSKTVLCPNGDGNLRPVTAPGRLGSAILLDQCDRCGGIWFDRFELYQIDEREAAGIDSLDTSALRSPRGRQDHPLCPQCRSPLSVFRDANIPKNIQMLICDACGGFWLNHGALLDYAGFRQARHKAPDPRLAAQYEEMLAATSEAEKWEGINQMAHRLGGPRDMLTGLPLDGSADELEKIDMAHEAAFTVIRTIGRLLFGI